VFKRILVSLDDCTSSEFIVAYVHSLTRLLGSRVTLLHVLTRAQNPSSGENSGQEAETEAAHALLERLARGARIPPRLRLEWSEENTVAQTILRVAKLEGVDLIVMGTQTGTTLDEGKLGSVSQAVAASSHIPVQLVPLMLEPQGYAARLHSAVGLLTAPPAKL
jgi:nucleotide-binding universal stress UspA family protein